MIVQGDFRSDVDFRYIEMRIKGCNLTDGTCLNGADLDASLNNLHLELPLMQTHVNLTQPEWDLVVEHYLNFDQYLVLDNTNDQTLDLFYSNSLVHLDDYPFRLFG